MLQIKHVKTKKDNDETQEIEPDWVVYPADRTPRVGRLLVYLIRLHGISANVSSVIVIVPIAQFVGVVPVVVTWTMHYPSSARFIYHERRNSITSPFPNLASVSLFYLLVGFFSGHRWCKAVYNDMAFGKGARVTLGIRGRVRVRTSAWGCGRKSRDSEQIK